MDLKILAAQFPVSLSIQKNIEVISEILEQSQSGELVVFPEGSVSGYSTDISFLDKIDLNELEAGLKFLQKEAQRRDIYLWVGACIKENGNWINAAFGFMPNGDSYIYKKINLAHHERNIIVAGKELPVFQIETKEGTVSIGIQLCRELRYPEQWGWLSRSGSQIILHLNNAVGNDKYQSVWKSHLVSRAAETQRFVISANNAGSQQLCPTMIIAPDGKVVGEIVSDKKAMLRATLDLSLVSNWYLNQCREDVVLIKASNDKNLAT